MKTVITGAAGFIGSRLTAAVARRGDYVTGIDALHDRGDATARAARAAALEKTHHASISRLDIVSDSLEEALDGVDLVFHLAAIPGVRSSWEGEFGRYTNTNILGTQRLLEALVSVAPRARLVTASSSSIYGDQEKLPILETSDPAPRSPYGVSKLAAEHLVGAYMRDSGVDAVCARLFTVCGPGQRPDMAIAKLISSAQGGREFVVTDATWTRDYTHVDDVVSALLMLGSATHFTQPAYNVSGGNRASILDLALIVESEVGSPPTLVPGGIGRGDPHHTWADTSAIDNEFNWTATRTLTDAVRDQVADRDGIIGITTGSDAQRASGPGAFRALKR